jgi:hypothetical protein
VIWVKALGSNHPSLLQNKTPILHLEVIPQWLCSHSNYATPSIVADKFLSMIVSVCSKQLCLEWHGYFRYTQIQNLNWTNLYVLSIRLKPRTR